MAIANPKEERYGLKIATAAQQVAQFMGAQWLNACGQVDAETTGARWAAVHGCP